MGVGNQVMKILARLAVLVLVLLLGPVMLSGEFPGLPEEPPPTQAATAPASPGTATTTATLSPTPLPVSFTFASMGDAQGNATNFFATVDQIEENNPDLVLFNGDLEEDGVVQSEFEPMVQALEKAGIFDRTFLVRGNHDNHASGSAGLWEHNFEGLSAGRPLPEGVTDYVPLDATDYYLSYSFDYANSIFIGLDDPGNIGQLTRVELTFLDTRLAWAEAEGLTHAFIFFHGPLYCVERTHCSCSEKADGSCTPVSLVSILNKHPIVSATFHGHEHLLGWTHMDSRRVPGLTVQFEQFLTSPSGGWTYNEYLYPDRMDYHIQNMDEAQGFALISVDGRSFTVSLYRTGSVQPIWSKKFTK